MPVTAIQFVLHVLGTIALVQQAANLPFQIGKIHLLLTLLELLKMRQQLGSATQHSLIQAHNFFLDQGVTHPLH